MARCAPILLRYLAGAGFPMATRPGSFVTFEFGLDLLLDGLEQRLETG